jgi:hypothetical protein
MVKKRKIKSKKIKGVQVVFEGTKPEKISTLSLRPSIGNIATHYNIGRVTLFRFLTKQGYDIKNLTLNSSLDANILLLIQNEFQEDKTIIDKVNGETIINFNPKIAGSSILSKKTDFPKSQFTFSQKVLHLSNNLFDKPKTIIKHHGLKLLNSFFTDLEAHNVCSKMSSSYTRKLCTDINKLNSNYSFLNYQIHSIADKALVAFGGYMLTFIYGLRNLKFKDQTALEIKNYDKVIPDFPIISFKSDNAHFNIAFFIKKNKKDNQISSDIRIFSGKSFEPIGFINEQGYVMAKLESFKPELTLFYESTKENNFQIFSGVETGECIICQHTLKIPNSCRIGIGPVCARKYEINRTLFTNL